MREELEEAKRKYIIRKLKKCGKCKFNNYVIGGNKFRYGDYCYVKEKEVIKLLFCKDFKKNRKQHYKEKLVLRRGVFEWMINKN